MNPLSRNPGTAPELPQIAIVKKWLFSGCHAGSLKMCTSTSSIPAGIPCHFIMAWFYLSRY